jgi:hypothetical protein
MRNPHRIVYNLNVIRNALTGLAAFILGDLPADTTPSAELSAT